MKQVLQQVLTGEVSVAEVPAPQLLPGCVLVRIAASLISAGTERAASEFAGKSLLKKAVARPDLVRDVISKLRRDGLMSAVQAVRSRLDQPLAPGYSSAGTVVGVGEGVTDLHVGDRVACAGAGYAVHAEIACIPRLLVSKIPESSPVTFDQAAFATVGAVALHGIRTADVKLGDLVAVIGLGLLGQLTVQILNAASCRVLGMDIVPERAELASRHGAEAATSSPSEFRDLCFQNSSRAGVDAVLITAETASSEPVNLAGEIARDRATVVAVGTVGMDIERPTYYRKELDFRISRSYGPGRYDTAFEQKGRDYPIGYVRWTETRNMDAFLRFLAGGKLEVQSLITHRFPIESARSAYELIAGRTGEPFLGVLITYPERPDESQVLDLRQNAHVPAPQESISVGLLGSGTFAIGVLLPAMKRVEGVNLISVCSATGSSSRHAAEKFGFQYCTTDENEVLGDACHSVHFLLFLAGSTPVEVQASSLANPCQYNDDNVIVSLRFANGSQGTISYLANGDRAYAKERVEVFGGGAVAVLDDFRRLELVRHGRKKVIRSLLRQDKGHRAEWAAFAHSIQAGEASPIPLDQLVAATLATLRIRDSLALGQPMSTDAAAFAASALHSASSD